MVLLVIATACVFICSTLLVLLVFLQNPKDQGGASALGTDMQQMIGVAHTSNVLEKITYSLAGLIFALTLLISFSIHQRSDKEVETSAIFTQLEKYAKQKSTEEK